MTIRLVGALFVILSCGGFGLILSYSVKRETLCMREFITALELMECELDYRMTPLPVLCRSVALAVTGPVRRFFEFLADEIDNQTASSVQECVNFAIKKCTDMPQGVRVRIESLGISLGLFDLSGQLKCIRAINNENHRIYENLVKNQQCKLRSYKTLALCAGAALAILFI